MSKFMFQLLTRAKSSRLYEILLIFYCISLTLTLSDDSAIDKFKRSLRTHCESYSCPPWNCQDDSAVIHGYCCHCPGAERDNVPVICEPDLKCPLSPEPLCSDYDFMMDCCCTGP